MILPAQAIKRIPGMITPFCERVTCGHSGMTYGLGPASYDVRVAETHVIPAGQFALASICEHLSMPDDVLAQVCDKSTWARRGLGVLNTIIDPGWRGFLTVELTNHSSSEITCYAGDPIAQLIFFRLEAPTELPYSGRYQDQEPGPQPAR